LFAFWLLGLQMVTEHSPQPNSYPKMRQLSRAMTKRERGFITEKVDYTKLSI